MTRALMFSECVELLLKDFCPDVTKLIINICFRFGHKRAVQIPVVLMAIFTATTGLCPNVYLYLESLFILGIGYGGYRLNCVILGTL